VAGERTQAVTLGGIAAIVGHLRRQPKPTIGNLQRYAAVVERIAERVPAILPARYGSVLGDVEELRFVLESRQRELRRRLAGVRGRVQMTVRVVRTLAASSTTSAVRVTAARRVRTSKNARGTEYLRLRATAAAAAREIEGFEAIRSAVKRWVKEERVEQRGGVATVNHLIPRTGLEAYSRAIQRAADGAGLRLIVSGPFPPYAFVQDW
jgi:hypothetical protein